jgi:outer membrane receptor protein involved in Fe transport
MHITKDSRRWRTQLASSAAVLALTATAAHAQDAASQDAGAKADSPPQEVIVVGTRIKNSKVTEALPVSVYDADQIDASGAVSGDDLMRAIPQMGDVLFSSANNPQTSNSARGDVNSVNLRSLGVGNTLVLLNGRRLVQHPTSQGTSDTGTVPVLSYNSNAIPVTGLSRVEVLLDGAAAIYGADAVAGVVNTVLKDDFDGLKVSSRYGQAEGTHMSNTEFNLFAGKNFGDGRGNVSLYGSFLTRTALLASDQDFTATADLRPLFADAPNFADSSVPNGGSSYTVWANFAAPGAGGAIKQGSTSITSTAGAFHIQPASLGCASNATLLSSDLCLARNNVSYGSNPQLRNDTQYGTTVLPSVRRLNLYATGHYDFANGVTAFGEIGYYHATSRMIQPPVILLNALWIPASNYWNPFGATTLPDGSANPNRLPNLKNVPASGLPVQLVRYRFVDTGMQQVDVTNYQSRFVGGLRGSWNGFDWESALTYSEAQATDLSPNVNTTKLQQSLALSTPDAYNPFNGGCVDTPAIGDCTPSSQTSIDSFMFEMKRVSKTTLAMWDFKMSRSDLFRLPGGEVGVAFGLEARHETQHDDRDANLDGTYTFTDMVTGETNLSNVAAVSPNPDTKGARTVGSAYVEFAVPVVSPQMRVPLMRSLNLQIAGRYENYSDFGSVAKPKFAAAWDVIDGVRLRGSWSQGFRAPNLEQTNATQYARLATNNDYIRCEAQIQKGAIASMNDCASTASASLLISGNPDLKPEESTNSSYGVVLQPKFIPSRFGAFTFTVDRWRIHQKRIVGLLGAQAALALDYYDRMNGSSNPNVVRADPTADDVAFFNGTNIAPAGEVISIKDQFVNLLPQNVEGVDFGLLWSLRRTPVGNFDFNLNAARLLKFHRDPGPTVDMLYEARDAGVIDPLTPLPDSSDLIAQNGRPEWKVYSSLTWSKGPMRIGASTQYVSAVDQTDFLGDDGNPWEVKARLVGNLYGEYRFKTFGQARDTRVRLGVNDISNRGPSLAENGYLGSIQRPYGRYWYVNLSQSF